MQVFAFADKLQSVVAADAVAMQNLTERLQIGGVDNEQFVFVELQLDRRHAERESTPVALKPGATAMAPPSPQVLIMEFAAAIAFGLLLNIVKIPLFARLKIS